MITKTDERGEYVPIIKAVAPDGLQVETVWPGVVVPLPGDKIDESVGYFVLPLNGSRAGLERLKAIQSSIDRFNAWERETDGVSLVDAIKAMASVADCLFSHYSEETRDRISERLTIQSFQRVFAAAMGAGARTKVEAPSGNSKALA